MGERIKILIFHNPVDDDAPEDERDVLEQAGEIALALGKLGFEPVLRAFDADLASLKAGLAAMPPHAIVNLVESVENDARLLFLAPAYFEHMRIPFTGASSEALFLTTSKILAKKIMQRSGIPTPGWLEPGKPVVSDLNWPDQYIIKPVWEEASVGLEATALISACSAGELTAMILERQRLSGRACFAERYVAGREFNLSIMGAPEGPRVLPPAEMIFHFPADMPRILDYKAKWEAGSLEYENTWRSFELTPQDAHLVAQLKHITLQCWEVFGLHGYARVDFRVDSAGNPFVLEINANPCLSSGSGFPAACEKGGMSYNAMVAAILDEALRMAAP